MWVEKPGIAAKRQTTQAMRTVWMRREGARAKQGGTIMRRRGMRVLRLGEGWAGKR